MMNQAVTFADNIPGIPLFGGGMLLGLVNYQQLAGKASDEELDEMTSSADRTSVCERLFSLKSVWGSSQSCRSRTHECFLQHREEGDMRDHEP